MHLIACLLVYTPKTDDLHMSQLHSLPYQILQEKYIRKSHKVSHLSQQG